jgi:hypothetical protein
MLHLYGAGPEIDHPKNAVDARGSQGFAMRKAKF